MNKETLRNQKNIYPLFYPLLQITQSVYLQEMYFISDLFSFLLCYSFPKKDIVNAGLYHYAGNNPVRYIDPDGKYDCDAIDQEIKTEVRRTFNGDFGADFFWLSMQAYNNGDYLKGFAYSLDGTAELFFDFFCAHKMAKGLGKVENTITNSGSKVFSSNTTTSTLLTESASSTKLTKNLISSGVSKPAQTAAHHIVAGNAKLAQPARDVLAKFNISINDAVNGVFLPANRNCLNITGANIHSTLHTNDYYETVNTMLSTCTTKNEVIETLGIIKEMLLKGEF